MKSFTSSKLPGKNFIIFILMNKYYRHDRHIRLSSPWISNCLSFFLKITIYVTYCFVLAKKIYHLFLTELWSFGVMSDKQMPNLIADQKNSSKLWTLNTNILKFWVWLDKKWRRWHFGYFNCGEFVFGTFSNCLLFFWNRFDGKTNESWMFFYFLNKIQRLIFLELFVIKRTFYMIMTLDHVSYNF